MGGAKVMSADNEQIYIVTIQNTETGEEADVVFDPTATVEDYWIDTFLANEATLFPSPHPCHPLTAAEAKRLAELLGVEATAQFRLELHVAVWQTLGMLLRRGWRGPRWLRRMLDRALRGKPVEDSFALRDIVDSAGSPAEQRVAIQEERGLWRIRRGERGEEERGLFLETLIVVARDCGSDLKLPQRRVEDQGGPETTPFFEFVSAALRFFQDRGLICIAASDVTEAERARLRARLDRFANVSRGPLIRQLERLKLKISQEKPIPWAHLK
jgi:hypothetical protein